MPPKQEMAEVIEWCENKKKEENRVSLVVRNPFSLKYSWMMAYPFISIDVPLEEANKRSIVYDSRTRTLWRFDGERWVKIVEDFEVD